MTSTGHTPRVSIGLPVYNGERYLDEAIGSILGQTFRDFELVICDNDSTDRTREICRRYAAADDRVRYYRNSRNIGGANNENLTFRLARGEYFRLSAHDDVCAPELIERCVEVLDADPRVILCHSAVVAIDGDGRPMSEAWHGEGTAATPHARLRQLASKQHNCEATYGVIRSEVLARTPLQKNYTGSDRVLLCELGLRGRFHQLRQPLFFKRYHPRNEYPDWRARMVWFSPDLERTGRITFPGWQELADFAGILARVRLPLRERILCVPAMLPWMAVVAKRMAKDVVVAGQMAVLRPERRRKRYARANLWSS